MPQYQITYDGTSCKKIVTAIKEFRTITHFGLKEAKAVIDEARQNGKTEFTAGYTLDTEGANAESTQVLRDQGFILELGTVEANRRAAKKARDGKVEADLVRMIKRELLPEGDLSRARRLLDTLIYEREYSNS